jgi:hypothetical protein
LSLVLLSVATVRLHSDNDQRVLHVKQAFAGLTLYRMLPHAVAALPRDVVSNESQVRRPTQRSCPRTILSILDEALEIMEGDAELDNLLNLAQFLIATLVIIPRTAKSSDKVCRNTM